MEKGRDMVVEMRKRNARDVLRELGLEVHDLRGWGVRCVRVIAGIEEAAEAMAAPGGVLIDQKGDVYLVAELEDWALETDGEERGEG